MRLGSGHRDYCGTYEPCGGQKAGVFVGFVGMGFEG
jgi:hypothetical protein